MTDSRRNIIDDGKIRAMIDGAGASTKEAVSAVPEILDKARERRGLTLEEASVLISAEGEAVTSALLRAAGEVKRAIYGERLVLFAPLYLSNYCVNDCKYCGFHKSNTGARTLLTDTGIEAEVRAIIDMGHKRLLLECGEDPVRNTIDYVASAISTIYSTKSGRGEIRRVNVNIAPPDLEGFKILKEAGIGTYQLFQETYHHESYEDFHSGPKADYSRQLFAHDLAFSAGIDDVGLGVLFGLYDYRFEVLSLISHANYLEKKFGVGPHTISMPRLRPAPTVSFAAPYTITDDELLKVIAVMRLALPYTGIILSTREKPALRSRAFAAGVTQASAGSATSPGGYGDGAEKTGEQFTVGDARSVSKFLKDALSEKLLPSFCTACYRRGRTGEAFMELAKPGEIQELCRPNAILTFKEYLEDYAPPEVKCEGEPMLESSIKEISDPLLRAETVRRVHMIEAGARDLYF